RRAGEEARGAGCVFHLRLEGERLGMRLPACEGRLEALGQVGSDVEPTGARPAAEPLDTAADGEVDAERGNVERHGSGRLVGVEENMRTGGARTSRDRLDVLDLPRLVEDVADRDEQRALVDRVDDRVLVLADDDLGAVTGLRLLHVADARKQARLEDDAP